MAGISRADFAGADQEYPDARWIATEEPGVHYFLVRPLRGWPAQIEEAGQFGEVLFTDGKTAVVKSPRHIEEQMLFAGFDAVEIELEPLAESRGRPPTVRDLEDPFDQFVDEIVASASVDTYATYLGKLCGEYNIMVDESPYTIYTRYTETDGNLNAGDYIFQKFTEMGLEAEFDSFDFQSGTRHSRNVVATLPGAISPDTLVIIGGHYDSVSPQYLTLAPGADDNASGTAGVLEAARVMKDYVFRYTIKFIAFAAEEQGLHGSKHYAQDALSQDVPIAAAVIMDMISYWNSHYSVIIEGETEWQWLMTIMAQACTTYTSIGYRQDYYSWGSDHVPFQNRGYASFLAIELDYPVYPCMHQTCDTFDKTDPDYAIQIQRASMATAAAVADVIGSSAVAVSGFGLSQMDSAVEISWWASPGSNVDFLIERSRSRVGFARLPGRVIVEPNGQCRFIDDDIESGGTYWYRLRSIDEEGNHIAAGPVSITLSRLSAAGTLITASENPTSGGVVFTAPKLSGSDARLSIFDVAGRLVRELGLSGGSDRMTATWDGTDGSGSPLPSGIYFVRASNREVSPLKLVLLR
jgi:hypothetical protein